MARTIALEELIGDLGKFREKTTEQCLQMLREEIPIGLTGNMIEHTKVLNTWADETVIGVDPFEVPYVQYVRDGRGPVYPNQERSRRNPKHAHSLRWVEYDGGGTSIHHSDNPGEIVYRMRSGPTKANDFIGRTVQKILSADLDVGGFKGWARRNVTRPVTRFFKNLWSR